MLSGRSYWRKNKKDQTFLTGLSIKYFCSSYSNSICFAVYTLPQSSCQISLRRGRLLSRVLPQRAYEWILATGPSGWKGKRPLHLFQLYDPTCVEYTGNGASLQKKKVAHQNHAESQKYLLTFLHSLERFGSSPLKQWGAGRRRSQVLCSLSLLLWWTASGPL